MPIGLEDLTTAASFGLGALRDAGTGYMYISFAHQPVVGALIGGLLANVKSAIDNPNDLDQRLAAYTMEENIAALRSVIEREKQQLEAEGLLPRTGG